MNYFGEGIYDCKLSDELQHRAKIELNEMAERRASDIEAIRTWIKQQPHFVNVPTADFATLIFLRCSRFSLEETKKVMDSYLTFKTMIPEWFFGFDTTSLEFHQALRTGFVLPLMNGYDRNGRRVVLLRAGAWNPSDYPVDVAVRLVTTISDVLLADEQAQINGFCICSDFTNATVSHVAVFTPTILKKIVVLFQEGSPFQVHEMHFGPISQVTEMGVRLAMSLASEEVRRKVVPHSGSNYLSELIPKEILPEEYGGSGGKISDHIETLIEQSVKQRERVSRSEAAKIDESKRPGKPRTKVQMFGMDGSFRKLDLD